MRPWREQVVKEWDAAWKLYLIRDWVLYVGRVAGKRDLRLIHRDNFDKYVFIALAGASYVMETSGETSQGERR